MELNYNFVDKHHQIHKRTKNVSDLNSVTWYFFRRISLNTSAENTMYEIEWNTFAAIVLAKTAKNEEV